MDACWTGWRAQSQETIENPTSNSDLHWSLYLQPYGSLTLNVDAKSPSAEEIHTIDVMNGRACMTDHSQDIKRVGI